MLGRLKYVSKEQCMTAKRIFKTREEVLKAIKKKENLDGASLKGIDLSHADLSGARLVEACLDGCNLQRANLESAHLYKASFKNSDLFNANLTNANIKESDMTGANLLEVKLDGTKLFGIQWGPQSKVNNEIQGLSLEKLGKRKKAKAKFREAEEIYRNIRIHLMNAGVFEEAADFFYREMVSRRKQLNLFSIKRLSSKAIDILCGYGEKTFRVIICAAALVFVNAVLFFIFGIQYKNQILMFEFSNSWNQNINEFFLSLYYSVVTLTTLGYGDIIPLGMSKAFAGIEAFLGAFMMALFVLVFGRKMMR